MEQLPSGAPQTTPHELTGRVLLRGIYESFMLGVVARLDDRLPATGSRDNSVQVTRGEGGTELNIFGENITDPDTTSCLTIIINRDPADPHGWFADLQAHKTVTHDWTPGSPQTVGTFNLTTPESIARGITPAPNTIGLGSLVWNLFRAHRQLLRRS